MYTVIYKTNNKKYKVNIMADKKQSSTILNLLVIIIGVVFAFLGIVTILTGYGVGLPTWLVSVYATLGDPAVLALLAAGAWTTAGIGIWAVVAGIFLFKEEEWAMGQTLVVLSLMALNSIPWVISEFLSGVVNWASVFLWVYLVIAIVSVAGFIYLLITSRRYH